MKEFDKYVEAVEKAIMDVPDDRLPAIYEHQCAQFRHDNALIWTTGAVMLPVSIGAFGVYAGLDDLTFFDTFVLALGSLTLLLFWNIQHEIHRAFQDGAMGWIKAVERRWKVKHDNCLGPKYVDAESWASRRWTGRRAGKRANWCLLYSAAVLWAVLLVRELAVSGNSLAMVASEASRYLTFGELVELLQALAWPSAVVVVAFLLRNEIRLLLPRLRHVKVLGTEATFEIITERVSDAIQKDEPKTNPFTPAQREVLREVITRRLTPIERHIIVLYYYEEADFPKIATKLNLPEPTVRQMHSSILSRLKAGIKVLDSL